MGLGLSRTWLSRFSRQAAGGRWASFREQACWSPHAFAATLGVQNVRNTESCAGCFVASAYAIQCCAPLICAE